MTTPPDDTQDSPQPKTGTRNVVCIGDSHTPDGHQPAKMPSPQPDFEALARSLMPKNEDGSYTMGGHKVWINLGNLAFKTEADLLSRLYASRAWVKWAEDEGMVSREHLIDQGKLFNLSNQTKDAKLAATRAMRDRLLEDLQLHYNAIEYGNFGTDSLIAAAESQQQGEKV